MKRYVALLIAVSIFAHSALAADGNPLGKPGLVAKYRHERSQDIPGSVVETLTLALGSTETRNGTDYQWLRLQATKANGREFTVWILGETFPPVTLGAARRTTARYILREGDSEPLEFRHRFTGAAVLPVLGAWPYLFPSTMPIATSSYIRVGAGGEIFPRLTEGKSFPRLMLYLGHHYNLDSVEASETVPAVPDAKVVNLLPDVLIGPAHNTRQKDDTRRWDNSDYELVRLTEDDYREMIRAGVNCLAVDAEQAKWIERLDVFYWGIGGDDLEYPECLYRSNYLGPALFLDEPAVCTRDHVIRPRLAKESDFRKAITPQIVLEEFRDYFRKAKYERNPTALTKGLAARSDVALGHMEFLQENIFSWETMISSAIHQLAEGHAAPPSALVFEPPGRVGTRRTLPEMNMTYGCQIPVDDPKNLTSIIYGFLRGAARMTGKSWGVSIYGHVDRTDAFWFQTHAYDLGATLFFYWDTYKLACVPYGEYLALSRNLRAHVESHPRRDLKKLVQAAEVVILFPPGYNLGHVDMGRGNLWGVGELNLERVNRKGVKYRVVMGNFFTEIERCIRLGVGYDLLWDVDGLDLSGYREVVRIREDGKVEVEEGAKQTLHDAARAPARPAGAPPQLTVELSADRGKAPLRMTARARVREGSAAVFYTRGTDPRGVYRNTRVAWELYGPEEEDYRFLRREGSEARIHESGSETTVEVDFLIEQPGRYRLRAATVDIAGRTVVIWKVINVDG